MAELRSGISHAALSDWLAGKRHPRPDSLRRLAAALGVPYEEALKAAGYLVEGQEQKDVERLSPMERELVDLLRSLPEAIRTPLLRGWLLTARGLLEQEARKGEPRGAAGEPSLQEGPAPAPR